MYIFKPFVNGQLENVYREIRHIIIGNIYKEDGFRDRNLKMILFTQRVTFKNDNHFSIKYS